MAAYYTSVEFLDKNVGRVLDALAESGHADDTLVIYSGDHGYMLGQHGRFEKHCSYEPAVRAPLIMRLPGRVRAGTVTPALVELIDIVPTVLDLCHSPVPENVQGRSLAKLLDGGTNLHRDCVFVEYAENEEAMIRTDRWKLIYSTGRRERQDGYTTGRPLAGKVVRLFDVVADPDENEQSRSTARKRGSSRRTNRSPGRSYAQHHARSDRSARRCYGRYGARALPATDGRVVS